MALVKRTEEQFLFAAVFERDVLAGAVGQLDFAPGNGTGGGQRVAGVHGHFHGRLREGDFVVHIQVVFPVVPDDAAAELAAEIISRQMSDGDFAGENGLARATVSARQQIAQGDVEEDGIELGAGAEAGKFAPVGGMIAEGLETKFEILALPRRARLGIGCGRNVVEVKLPCLRAADIIGVMEGDQESALAEDEIVTKLAEAHHGVGVEKVRAILFPLRQRRLAALKGHDGLVQVMQGNGDFHNFGMVATSLISSAVGGE